LIGERASGIAVSAAFQKMRHHTLDHFETDDMRAVALAEADL
jgi:hypothetical protein